MKKENYIVIGLASIFTIVMISLFAKNYFEYRNLSIISNNPFNSIEILGQRIRLKETARTYEVEIDCNDLEENTQIFYYRLKEEYTDYKIAVSSKVYKDNKIITENFEDATAVDINVSVLDANEEYEQVYHIKATCISDEEDDEEETSKKDTDSKKTNKKSKK